MQQPGARMPSNQPMPGATRARRLLSWGTVISLVGVMLAATDSMAYIKPSTAGLEAEAIVVEARPVSTFEKLSSQATFGRLAFRGGLVLTSSSRNFGGWSGLVLDERGRRLVAVSDAGSWMIAEIAYEGSRPKGLSNARLGPLQALNSRNLRKNKDRDAEAVALASGTLDKGELLISFEGNHRIGRFPVERGGVAEPTEYLKPPPELKAARKRDGMEAMTILKGGPRKGQVVAIAEHFKNRSGDHTGWIWEGGTPKPFHLTNIDDFDITDTASLADGSLLVLERRFRWLEGIKMRLRHLRAGEIAPGALIAGEIVMEAGMGHEIDNMEGLAVHTGPSGETVLTLISDDNFNGFLQRTILLQFTLHPESQSSAR